MITVNAFGVGLAGSRHAAHAAAAAATNASVHRGST
jgi:hypothetical protein